MEGSRQVSGLDCAVPAAPPSAGDETPPSNKSKHEESGNEDHRERRKPGRWIEPVWEGANWDRARHAISIQRNMIYPGRSSDANEWESFPRNSAMLYPAVSRIRSVTEEEGL